MHNVLIALLSAILAGFRTRFALQVEIVALRHQLNAMRRSVPSRPKLHASDRFLWILLSRLWPDWRSALIIIKPETVIAWHRKGFRLFWTWKSTHGRSGRPGISTENRDLIRTMSKANVIWGAPRIHGELLKLGMEVSQATVAKYMVKPSKPPSQTWRTFLENHVRQMVAVGLSPCPKSAGFIIDTSAEPLKLPGAGDWTISDIPPSMRPSAGGKSAWGSSRHP
jgi:putative transposase